MSHQVGHIMTLAIAVGTVCYGISTTSQAVPNVLAANALADRTACTSIGPTISPARFDKGASRTFLVPANSILMLGSMDVSAQRHVIEVSVSPANTSEGRWDDHAIVRHISWSQIPDRSDRLTAPNRRRPASTIPVTYSKNVSGRSRRRFDVPHFSAGVILNRHVMGVEIVRGRSVVVFSDDESADSQNTAQQIITLIGAGLQDFVEREIGPIADIDNDGSLTIMLTPLTDGQQQSSGEPIVGCVRASDFLQPQGDFAGDIVYIDPAIVERQTDAILAHELAHAATFSAMSGQLKNSTRLARMPCWLNEAIAHYIERRVCPESENMRQRLLSFYKAPHLYPVVIPDASTSSELKRGPARAAGCLFLETVFSRLDTTIACGNISTANRHFAALESVTGHQIEELLRLWGTEVMKQSPQIPTCKLNIDQCVAMNICGTAFRWIAPAAEPRRVTVSAAAACRLQVTVIHLDR